MLLATVDVPGKKKNTWSLHLLVQCDACGKTSLRKSNQASFSNQHHFCDRVCSAAARKIGGINYDKWMENRDLGAASRVREATMIERYGAKSSFEVSGFAEVSRATSLKNWGTEHPMNSDEVKRRQRDAIFRNHGVTNAYQVAHVVKKSRDTVTDRYGAPTFMESNAFKSLVRSIEFQARRHQAMKRNGTYRKSKPEDELYELLCAAFGTDNVERQVRIPGTRWEIDYYVAAIDTYVQYDGDYWHGLDRPIDVIAQHRTQQDAQIHKKWLTDREQDAWFPKQGLKLVRVTGTEFKSDSVACLLRIVGNSDGTSLPHTA